RRNIIWTFVVSIIINIGMWFERFDIIVIDLSKDRLTSSWTLFQPTFVDIGTFMGTIGFFFVLFLLYARTFPVISQATLKGILKSSGEGYKRLRAEHGDDVSHVQQLDQGDFGPAANISHKRFDNSFAYSRNPVATNPSVPSEQVRQGKIAQLLANIGVFDAKIETQDDLQRINGIGPVLEQKLHQIGIFTYTQISRMTDVDYELLKEIISEFPGSPQQDDWAGQALILKNEK